MELNIKSIALTAVLAASSVICAAQNTRSAYFTEGYLYRYQMNPAIANERNFVAMPALGNMNVGINGNLSLDDVLYNVNGETTTFLNPSVSASEFLDGINDKNRLGADIKVGILAAGFKAFKGYNTIALNVRTNVQTQLPKSLFSLLKEGVENTTYDISDVRAHADAYVELALGHSHKINDQWRVGATMKFLVGGANIDAEFDKAYLTLGEDSWNAVVEGQLQSSIKGLTYERDVNDRTGHEYVSGFDVDGTGINGFGMAFDLGAEFKLNRDWTFSASVLDFGFINWSNNVLASTNGVQEFSTDKYSFNVDDDATNSFENEWDNMRDDLSAL